MTRHIVLIGMMGAGKTTVGHILAARLGRRLVDSDKLVEARTGRTVRQIWETDGEPAYRVLESAALTEALAATEPLVVAAAGGVLLREENRSVLRSSGARVIWLRADPDVLADRATRGDHRPLLDGDPAGTMRRLLVEREPLYRSAADVTIDVDDRSPQDVVDAIVAVVDDVRRVTVALGERSYDVAVGHGAVDLLRTMIPSSARRAAIVSQASVPFVVEPRVRTQRFEIGDGEQHKTLGTVEALTRSFAAFGLTRSDVVIAVGGGMVTDVAGFAAASWHRGVPVIHVATTLLGMVDAAIGGKTGVNLPEGKNLVGAFWQPIGVICDLDALATLPDRERRSGDGEMAKYHFLTGDDLDAMDLTSRVARCVAIKAEIVARDEREGGRRAVLNYGHTLAHALEIASGHELTHGEAVGIGLVYAAELARMLGRIDDDRVAAHRAVVGGTYGLATTMPRGVDVHELVALMGRDKKAVEGLTFVLDGPRGVEIVPGVAEHTVRAAADGGDVTTEVRTERLLLRGWTDADRVPFASINADPAVMEFIGPLMSVEQSDAFVDRMVANWSQLEFGLWCVDVDGECIGFTGLNVPIWEAHFTPCVEVGWRLASASWGRGYATEAAQAAVAFGFGELGLDEIVSFTTVANVRSRRVMEKLGMVHDPADDFDHPTAAPWLRPHVLYRLRRPAG